MPRTGPEVSEGGEQSAPPPLEQRKALLKTKLFVPPLRPKYVYRPRLIERINNGLDKRLILISAPAGYGKTTLVSNWLHESEVTAAWISLDESDNDPICFLQNFIAAIQKIVPTLQLGWLGVLHAMEPATYETLLHLIINEIAERAATFVLVLDDFHVIAAQSILEMLASLLEHMPPQMHLLLLSRSDPPVPLSRLRARNQLVEIRAEQLRFTNEEVAAFLNEVMGLRLDAADIAAMERRTEGWIAGLQLASIALQATASQAHNSMQDSQATNRFVTAFTGSHHYIMDYLIEEVLNLQPEKVRLFLQQTSILSSMCAALCEAVVNVEGSEPINGQAMLEALEQLNLFIIPLDDKRQWYRYHHLFADTLNLRLEHLSPRQIPKLHRRASHWYEQNAMIPEAIQQALMAGEQRRAVQLVEQQGCALIMRGEGFTLLKWVEAVETYVETHPWLAILKAWALALTGQPEQVGPTLQTAERLIFAVHASGEEVKIMQGSMAAVRAHIANLHGEAALAVNYAQGALEYLPNTNAFSCSLRSVATSILGDASQMNGNLEQARRAYSEAARMSQAAGNIYMTMIANSNLADILIEQGKLHQAYRIYSESLQLARRPDGQELPLADRFYGGLSKIAYEWNYLEDAAQYADQCIELCQQWGNSNLLAKGYVLLARLERARCNLEKAQEAMRAAEQLVSEQRLSTRQSAWVKVAAARWWIVEGGLERAYQFIQESGTMQDGEIPYQRESEYLLLLRLLLAQGEYKDAEEVAGRLLRMAEAAQRKGRMIEILVLQALAWQGMKGAGRAMEVLGRALALAQAEGYTRVFLDEGEPMLKLLHQAKLQRTGPGYAAELLSAAGRVTGTQQLPAQLLIEPLTGRELEVLTLIEAGCSNQDIAERLVISMPTVKRHISNIYAKLGAKSRTQAVVLGRELRLFE